jgi:type II secretory pathway component PulF
LSYIAIEEKSSELGHMVGLAVYTYQERLFNKMQKWVLPINPFLLMVLGGCIAALIVGCICRLWALQIASSRDQKKTFRKSLKY